MPGITRALVLLLLLLVCPFSYAQRVDVYSRPLREERRREVDVDHNRIDLARKEALSAIGALGSPSDLSFLEEAARLKSPRKLLEQAADQAISAIRARF